MEDRAPGVLFDHTLEHREVGDHVDEIRFSEPVVVSSCEIKDFQAWPSGEVSCGVELFAHVRGEARFRRVCPTFAYTSPPPSASTSLEVEVLATDHLVIRGVYSSVTLVIYGNLVRDLDLNLLEDTDESVTPATRVPSGLNIPSNQVPEVASLVWKVASLARDSSSARVGLVTAALSLRNDKKEEELLFRSLTRVAEEAEKSIQIVSETEALLQLLSWIESSLQSSSRTVHAADTLLAALAAVQLLCVDSSACFKFVVADGMRLLIKVLQTFSPDSMVVLTLALEALESSSRHAFACEDLIGSEKHKAKLGYAVILSALLRAPAVSQVAVVILQRLRVYELTVHFQAAVDSLLVEVSAGTDNAKEYLAKTSKSLKLLTNVLHLKDDFTSSFSTSWFTPGAIETECSDKQSKNYEKYIVRILQERRLMSSVAAYVSVPVLHDGDCSFELMNEVTAAVQAFLVSLVSSGYGTLLLSAETEATSLVMAALSGLRTPHEESTYSLREATSLITENVILPVQDIHHLLEQSLFVVNMFTLLQESKGWQERLWCLSKLVKSCRTRSGREALLAVLQIEEVFSGLVEVLASATVETTDNAEAIHYGLEILYVLFTDSSLSAWRIWMRQASRLQEVFRVLKDTNDEIAETVMLLSRLQLLVDVSIVYQSEGVAGLLKLAASTAGSELDSLQDATNSSPLKLLGDDLHDSLLQLTSCMQILASVCTPSIAAALIGEGAVALIATLLEDASAVLQDELMAEYVNGEPTKLTSVMKLLVPTLLLLASLFQKIQLEGRQYRNTKLVSVLLRLHRIVSGMAFTHTAAPPYSLQGLEQSAVLRLTASCLAFWPVSGWEPALQMFSSKFDGPVETCSSLILLADLLPRETPSNPDTTNIFQDISLEVLLGTTAIRQTSWHAQASLKKPMLEALVPSIEQLAHVTLRLATSVSSFVINLLTNAVTRISCASASHAALVLRPLLTYIAEQTAVPTGMDHFRVKCYIKFLTELASHPAPKAILLQEEALEVLSQALTRFARSSLTDDATFVRCTLAFVVRICQSRPQLNFQNSCTVASLLNSLSEILPLETCFELLSDALTKFYSLRYSSAALIAVQLRLENTAANGNTTEPLLLLVFRRLCTAFAAEGGNHPLVLRLASSFAFGAVKMSAAGKSSLGMGALKLLFGLNSEDVQESVIEQLISVIDEKHGDQSNRDDKTNSLETKKALQVLQRLLQRPLQLKHIIDKVQSMVDGTSSLDKPSEQVISPWIRLKTAATSEDLDFANEETERAIESSFENDSSAFTWECSAELTLPTVKPRPVDLPKKRRRKARWEQGPDQPVGDETQQTETYFQVDDAAEEFTIEEPCMLKEDDEDNNFVVGRSHLDSSDFDYVPEKQTGTVEVEDPTPRCVTATYASPPILQPLFANSVFPPAPQPPVSAHPFPLAVQLQQHLAPAFAASALQLHQLQAQQTQYHLQHSIYQQALPVLSSLQERQENMSSLQQLLVSPQAIQELVQDQGRLTRLLEEHPRLLTLLQERFDFG